MIEFPGEELLAARARLLDGIMATWRQPAKADKPQPAPPAVITVEAALVVAEKHRALWQAAQAEKQAILDEGSAGRIDGYWKAEHSARARFVTSLLILEALAG